MNNTEPTIAEKRAKIAEAVGFRWTPWARGRSISIYYPESGWLPHGWTKPADGNLIWSCGDNVPEAVFVDLMGEIPFDTDLNAMHAAEMALDPSQHHAFRCRLWEITDTASDRSFVSVNGEEHNRKYCSATPEQRFEAFLMVLHPLSP